MTEKNELGALTDNPSTVTVSKTEKLGGNFHVLERYSIILNTNDGRTIKSDREVLRVGSAVGVLALDLLRRKIVLIRQFRLPAHLANGRGELIEIVAGHVKDGESPADTAKRECMEEIGTHPISLHKMFSFLPVPGSSDELATMFLAIVDSTQISEHGGEIHEGEDTQPFCIDMDDAISSLASNKMLNGYLILALQWLALNRNRLDLIISSRESNI